MGERISATQFQDERVLTSLEDGVPYGIDVARFAVFIAPSA
jgi:hypothetical protein